MQEIWLCDNRTSRILADKICGQVVSLHSEKLTLRNIGNSENVSLIDSLVSGFLDIMNVLRLYVVFIDRDPLGMLSKSGGISVMLLSLKMSALSPGFKRENGILDSLQPERLSTISL